MNNKLKGMRVEVYRERFNNRYVKGGEQEIGDWRWRRIKKGRITHASTEGYTKFSGCMNNLREVYVGALGPIYFLDELPRSRGNNWWGPFLGEFPTEPLR